MTKPSEELRSAMPEETKPPVHPVQINRSPAGRQAYCPKVVTLAAYEVYSKVFSPQAALITGDCRGGFGVGELIAFLYARSFPRKEWRQRVDEAFRGMENIK